MENNIFSLDDYLSGLEEEIGEIVSIGEWSPGVYHVEARREEEFIREYFVVLDAAPMAGKVQAYGKKIDGLRIYAHDDDSSGWRIVQYEVSKYSIAVKGKPVPESLFLDRALYAMELHPEYFGMFPVPFHTPHGYTLRCRTLDNGIYWLETSRCKELLAVCFPVWDAELSAVAMLVRERSAGEGIEEWKKASLENAADYMFFSREFSCIPLYELMETRGKWDGTVINRPALMNAIWECMPKYALHLNGEKDPGLEAVMAALTGECGVKAMPDPDGKRVIGMFPDAGTDFLLLK